MIGNLNFRGVFSNCIRSLVQFIGENQVEYLWECGNTYYTVHLYEAES